MSKTGNDNATIFAATPTGWIGSHHGRAMRFNDDLAFIFEVGDHRPIFVGPVTRARQVLQDRTLFERLALKRHKTTAPHAVSKVRSTVRMVAFPPSPAGQYMLSKTLHNLMLNDWRSLDDEGALTVAEATASTVVRVGQSLDDFLCALKAAV